MKELKIKVPTQLETFKKIRKVWVRSPVEKVVPNTHKKNRQQLKRELRDEL